MRGSFGSLRLPIAGVVATVLASLSLGGTFLTAGWFFPSVAAVLVTAGATEVARRLALPRTLVPVAGLVALLGYLVLRYARDEALLWVLPSHQAVDRLQELVTSGRNDIERYAAPVGVSPGIELLTVAGVGLVALAVDTLAVTARRAALAGLPLLALYTVPTSVALDGVGWVAFLLGGAGYLMLLLTESRERVSRWGRPMRFIADRNNWRPQVETSPLTQVGRRVGAAALGLAIVVPAVLPMIEPGSYGFGGSGFGPGQGSGNTVDVINPIIDLGQDLRRGANRPVIRYDGPPTYLRLVGLDVFDGDSWAPSRLQVSSRENNVEDGLVGAPGLSSLVETQQQRHRMEVFDLEETWLPLPYPATLVENIDGRWVYDVSTFNAFSVNTSTRQLGYDVTSLSVLPTVEQLRAAPRTPDSVRRYLELPTEIPGSVLATAREVTRGQVTDYDKALALQQWFRDPAEFSYSTEVSQQLGDRSGSEAIAAFLQTRRGYCVHFASAMAVMARQLLIPARVAIGFTPGVSDGEGNRIVTLHDAHAWPELYFENVGWVAFEPTPAARTGQPPPWARGVAGAPGPPGSVPSGGPSASASGSAGLGGSERRDSGEILKGPGSGDGSGAQGVFRRLNLPLAPTLVVLGMLVALLVPVTTRALVRRRRWRTATTPAGQVEAAWGELRDTLLDFGHGWRASDPPRRGTARIIEELALSGPPAEALSRLGSDTERARYAPELGEIGDGRADVAAVRAELDRQATGLERLRARLLPRSTRQVARALGDRVADGLDAIDAAVAAGAARLRPRRHSP